MSSGSDETQPPPVAHSPNAASPPPLPNPTSQPPPLPGVLTPAPPVSDRPAPSPPPLPNPTSPPSLPGVLTPAPPVVDRRAASPPPLITATPAGASPPQAHVPTIPPIDDSLSGGGSGEGPGGRSVAEAAVAVGQPSFPNASRPSQAASDPLVGSRIGRFQIVSAIGRGGMGVVYLAQDMHSPNNERVAVKFLRPEAANDPHLRHLFLKEADHMHHMREPGIMPVTFVSHDERLPHYVMPLMEGGSLASRMKPDKPFEPLSELLRIMTPIAEALLYAHDRRGVIHRDIKPENVLLDSQGRPYLSDFGLVRTVWNDSLLPDNKEFRFTVGTRPYMAPEIVNGNAGDFRVDIYSFGAMLYELCTGRRPYLGDSTEEIFAKIKLGPPPPPDQINPALPKGWKVVIESAMGRELPVRYAHMKYLLDDLRRLADGRQPLGVQREVSTTDRPPPVLPGPSGNETSLQPPALPHRMPDASPPPLPPIEPSGSNAAAKERFTPPRPNAPSSGSAVGRVGGVLVVILLLGGVAAAAWFLRPKPTDGLPAPIVEPAPPEPETYTQKKAYEAIVVAINADRLEVIEAQAKILNPLVDASVQSNDFRVLGQSLLQVAVRHGNLKTLEKLVECKLYYDHPDDTGRMAVHWAAASTDPGVIRFLHDKLKVDLKARSSRSPASTGVEDETPISIAIRSGRTLVVDAILELDRGVIDTTNDINQNLVHLAAKDGNKALLEVMLKRASKEQINAQDRQGRTPLHLAALKSRADVITLLLRWGADKTVEDNVGLTPAKLAERQLDEATARLIDGDARK